MAERTTSVTLNGRTYPRFAYSRCEPCGRLRVLFYYPRTAEGLCPRCIVAHEAVTVEHTHGEGCDCIPRADYELWVEAIALKHRAEIKRLESERDSLMLTSLARFDDLDLTGRERNRLRAALREHHADIGVLVHDLTPCSICNVDA